MTLTNTHAGGGKPQSIARVSRLGTWQAAAPHDRDRSHHHSNAPISWKNISRFCGGNIRSLLARVKRCTHKSGVNLAVRTLADEKVAQCTWPWPRIAWVVCSTGLGFRPMRSTAVMAPWFTAHRNTALRHRPCCLHLPPHVWTPLSFGSVICLMRSRRTHTRGLLWHFRRQPWPGSRLCPQQTATV